jgi:apolipoprotein N-acyltransferase
MKKFHPLVLSVLSGLLLFAAWPVSPLTFLIFIAFIPLMWLERQKSRRFFGWVYLAMLTFNVATTWWIWNASPVAIGAWLANSLLMCLPWLGFRAVRRRLGDAMGYCSLVVFWLSFEYLHLQDWGLSWPWLTLGNVFATHPGWVEWYEYTGTSGGGLWVLTVNVLLFLFLWDGLQERKWGMTRVWWALGLLAAPAAVSLALGQRASRPADRGMDGSNIVIVQPNIDPYDKLLTGSFDMQLHRLIRLSDSAIDSNTVLVVWPETALYNGNGGFDEARLTQNYFLRPLWAFLQRHPRINLLTGIESLRLFSFKHSPTAVKIPDTDTFVEYYNTAAIMDSSGPVMLYHKSRFVPGAESLPPYLRFLVPLFEKFGATEDGYTGQEERAPLETTNHTYRIAPAVCYESIYGEFMSGFVRNGADVLAVITNDGWWGNTPGYRQHASYARLRAIETRRWVLHAANTGISCIIDPAGNILDSRPWYEESAIRQTVPASSGQTFYVRFGDGISKLMLILAASIFGWLIVTFIKKRTSRG